MEINEEFLNWCDGKGENEFRAQRLFSKLSNEDIDFLKDQYEARLKADMVAMLIELQDEIKYTNLSGVCKPNYIEGFNDSVATSVKKIQQKIDKIKENTDK